MELRRKTGFLLAVAFALGWLAYSLVGAVGIGKQALLFQELDKVLYENSELVEVNHKLAGVAKALKERNDYIEKVAREELGLVKRNEIIFQFSKDDCRQSRSHHINRSVRFSKHSEYDKTKLNRKPRGD